MKWIELKAKQLLETFLTAYLMPEFLKIQTLDF